jgi:TIR domain
MSQPHNDSAPDTAQPRPPVEVFYSYSHKDEEFLEKLITHLSLLKRKGVITGWHDRQISAGAEWKNRIDERLESAGVITALRASAGHPGESARGRASVCRYCFRELLLITAGDG